MRRRRWAGQREWDEGWESERTRAFADACFEGAIGAQNGVRGLAAPHVCLAAVEDQAAALTLAPVGTDAIVFRICEAIW